MTNAPGELPNGGTPDWKAESHRFSWPGCQTPGFSRRAMPSAMNWRTSSSVPDAD